MVLVMGNTLDIAPLRSLVAVADHGGFQRAATSLDLSQAAVSQHVRRLEAVIDMSIVERHGRRSRFTPAGEQLVARARKVLALHDEALEHFRGPIQETVVIGSTEHGAAQLLPHLAVALQRSMPELAVQFRLDRGQALRESLASGKLSLALLIGPANEPQATPVGDLELTWYSMQQWVRPVGPVPLVAFDQPCALRARAVETLAHHGIESVIGAEANQLAGVHAAVAAGLGVALMATLGQTPHGLEPRPDLPAAAPLPLAIWARAGLDPAVPAAAAQALGPLLATSPQSRLPLAEGA